MGKDKETEIDIQGLTLGLYKQIKFNCGAERHHYSMFNVDELVKSQFSALPSFRRKPESSKLNGFWMPDQVRHDDSRTFYRTVNVGCSMYNVYLIRQT